MIKYVEEEIELIVVHGIERVEIIVAHAEIVAQGRE